MEVIMESKKISSFETEQNFYCLYICKMNSYYSNRLAEGRVKIIRFIRLDKRVFSSLSEFKNIKQNGVEVIAQEYYRAAKKYNREKVLAISRLKRAVRAVIESESE